MAKYGTHFLAISEKVVKYYFISPEEIDLICRKPIFNQKNLKPSSSPYGGKLLGWTQTTTWLVFNQYFFGPNQFYIPNLSLLPIYSKKCVI